MKVYNKINIYTSRFFLLSIYVIINLIMFCFLDMTSLNITTIITIIQLIVNLIFIKLFKIRIFSLPGLFIIFSYVFHLGHLLLITFGIDVVRPFDVIELVGEDLFLRSCIIVILCNTFLVLGILICNLKSEKISTTKYVNNIEECNIIIKIGLILVFIGILPKIYIDLNKIIAYINGNYLDTYKIRVSGIIQTIANFTETGIMMLIIGYQDEKRKANLIFYISFIYQVGIMFTGNRANEVLYIIALLFLYFRLIKNIKFKDIILFVIIGYMGLVFLNTISDIRMAELTGINEIINIFMNNFNNSPIFKALAEFGGTLISLSYSILFFPNLTPFNMGKTYLLSIFAAIPSISSISPNIIYDFNFVNNFPKGYRFALGGSYIGELYFNFGIYCIFAVVIVGFIVGSVGRTIEKSINNKKWLNLSISIILFPSLLLWIRGYYSDMIRDFIWTITLILILYYFMKKRIRIVL